MDIRDLTNPVVEPQERDQGHDRGTVQSTEQVANTQAPVDQPGQAQAQQPVPIAALDENDEGFSDASSSAEESDSRSSTASLRSSILDYRRENGRTYHTYSEGKYVLPNDVEEQDRLDMQHHLWAVTWKSKLCLCPKEKGAKRVLDVGTGTGIWALDYADEHPEAEIVGVDLSPIQPGYTPPNCRFEVDDVDKDWTWTRPFDFIFVRHGNSCFESWEKLLKRAYDNLEPGGYIELQDNPFPILCDDGSLEGTSIAKWSSLLIEAVEKMGRSIEAPAKFKQMLEDAGFVDVVEVKEVWPLSPWPKDEELHDRGKWVRETSLFGIEASCLALFTRILGWTREEVLVFCAGVRQDFRNPKIHAYWNVYGVYGRKPLAEPENLQPGA